MSQRPGMAYLPDASRTVASCGTWTRLRDPAAVMRPFSMRITLSFNAGEPVESSNVAPTIASFGAGAIRADADSLANAARSAWTAAEINALKLASYGSDRENEGRCK